MITELAFRIVHYLRVHVIYISVCRSVIMFCLSSFKWIFSVLCFWNAAPCDEKHFAMRDILRYHEVFSKYSGFWCHCAQVPGYRYEQYWFNIVVIIVTWKWFIFAPNPLRIQTDLKIKSPYHFTTRSRHVYLTSSRLVVAVVVHYCPPSRHKLTNQNFMKIWLPCGAVLSWVFRKPRRHAINLWCYVTNPMALQSLIYAMARLNI